MGPLGTNFSEILIKIQNFHSRKCLSKYRPRNGGHFVQWQLLQHVRKYKFQKLTGTTPHTMISHMTLTLWVPKAFAKSLLIHYNDVIMSAMASQITSLPIDYSTVYSGADQMKHQSSTSLAFVRGIHRWPVNSPHKGPLMRKVLPFDVVIMSFEKKMAPVCEPLAKITDEKYFEGTYFVVCWRSHKSSSSPVYLGLISLILAYTFGKCTGQVRRLTQLGLYSVIREIS